MTSLPAEFERRFLAGHLIVIAPMLAAVQALVWAVNRDLFGLFLLGHLSCLAVWAALLRPAARRGRMAFEFEISQAAALPRLDTARSHALPLVTAVVVIGLVNALLKKDWRWMVLTCGIGGILGVGILLRWIIYDRWIAATLARRQQA